MEIGRTLPGIAAIFLLLLFAVSADTQTQRAFTTDNGLAGDSVTSMIEAQNGDLWIATDNGISQFNGFFETHLGGEYICSLLQSSDGCIWASTGECFVNDFGWPEVAGRIYIYDGEAWQIQHFGLNSWWNSIICPVFESSDGTIWAVDAFESYNEDSKCDAPKSGEIIPLYALYSYDGAEWTPHFEIELLSEMEVNVLLESSEGTVWVGANNGLHSYSGRDWKLHLSGKSILALVESPDGVIWVGTEDYALYSYDGKAWQEHAGLDALAETGLLLDAFEGNIWINPGDGSQSYYWQDWMQYWSGMQIRFLFRSSDGIIWAGTRFNGLRSYNDGIWYEQERQSATGVSVLFESSNGTVWTATSEGLRSWDGTNWARHELPDGISAKVLLETSDGTMVAGTNNGIFYYEGGVWKHAIHLNNYFPTEFLFESADGRIWAGTSDGYLAVTDDLTPSPPSDPEDIFSGPYFALIWPCGDPLDGYSCNLELGLGASDGVVWVAATIESYATGSGSVLYNYDAAANEWTMSGLGMHVCSLFESSDGSIWVSAVSDDPHRDWADSRPSAEDGLHSYDGSAWEHRKWLSREDACSCILFGASDGSVWAGTGNGLYKYDGDRWSSHLSGMHIRSLAESSDGSIWVGTEANGLQIYDGIRWYRRTTADGLPVTELLEDSSGNWWMVTQNGVARYKPQPNENPPVIRIVEPQNQDITIGSAAILVQWTAGDKETESHLLTYVYKLNGNSWEKTGLDFVTLTGLSEGSNLFQIHAVDSDFNHSALDILNITVDTTPPNVLISSPVEGEVVGGVVRIEGGVSDTDLVEFQVEYAEGESPSDTAYKLIRSYPVGEIDFGELAQLDTTTLDEGKYTIRVRAIDELDHARDDMVVTTVDNTRPVVEIESPIPNQKLKEKTTVLAKVDDPHLAVYTLKIMQGDLEKWSETVEITKSQTIEREGIDTSAIYGSAIIRITAVDKAKNESERDDIEVFFDNEGARPIARLESPRADDVVAGAFEIMGEAKSVGVFKRYNVRYAVGHGPAEDDWVDIAEGSSTAEERLATWDTTGLDDGEYSIRLTAIDENDYTSEQTVHVVIDNTEPAIELTSPVDGGIETGEVLIKGTVTDNNFANCMVEFAPGVNPGTGWEQLGEISESETIERTWRTDGLDGLYSLRITASDRAIPVANQTTLVRTITLDNTVAEAMITSPQEDQVIKDTVEIIGTANDDNFSDYQVFWGAEDDPITDMITTPVINGILASWDTAGLDGIYAIRLVAHDRSQHEAIHSVSVVVDNTDPTAEITSPQNYDQVGGVVELRGTATDANFREYTVEYGEGPSPQAWTLASEVARYTTGVTKGKLFDWITDDKVEIFTLRVTVKDAVEHEKQASVIVDVMPPVKSQEGGERTSTDKLAALYLPPRTLSKDEVITINSAPPDENQSLPDNVRFHDLAYDIGPSGLEFNSIKPATLQIRLGNKPVGSQKRIALFRWDTSVWVFLGGTVQEDKITIGITQTGHYALMETDIDVVDLSEVGSPFTCQPRVFSPEAGQTTNISFSLQEEASVTLKIYNIDGRLQRTLVSDDIMHVGRNAVLWDGRDEDGIMVSSGLYMIAFETGEQDVKTKTVVIRNR